MKLSEKIAVMAVEEIVLRAAPGATSDTRTTLRLPEKKEVAENCRGKKL